MESIGGSPGGVSSTSRIIHGAVAEVPGGRGGLTGGLSRANLPDETVKTGSKQSG